MTEMQVKNAKARERDYKLADSEGLYLYVTAKGHRSWRMKYRFVGKERRLVLGAYPDLGLREARDRKADARKLLREGRDPGIEAVKAVDRTSGIRGPTCVFGSFVPYRKPAGGAG